jgi:hypothetical protein
MTIETSGKSEKDVGWREQAKEVIKLNTFGCLRNGVPSLRTLA